MQKTNSFHGLSLGILRLKEWMLDVSKYPAQKKSKN